jgi:HK97 family phage portal protein
MSAHVVATRAGNRRLPSETRSAGWGGGAWLDPTAIPPPGFGQLQRAGVIVSEKSLLQVDVVFTALRIITTAILKMGDPRAYQEELSDDNIPFRRFLADQPEVLSDTFGGRLFQYDGRRRTLMSMALFGEAFWYVLDRDRLAYPAALDVLHPAFMEVKVASAIDVRANRAQAEGDSMYIYGSGRDKKLLDPGDVIHIPFMAMPQARRALSSVEYVAVSGALAMAAYEFGSTWFSQGASPSFLLSTEAKLGQPEVERIAEKFVIDHAGLGSAHLPLVLDNGLKADKVMASPDEAQYTTTLEYSRNVIASWFGVDEMIPNALQRQTPQPAHTSQERMQRFITFTLSGYTVPLEEAYSSLLPKGRKATLPEDNLLTPDPQGLSEEITALRQTQVATPNDLRVRKLHWPPSDDPAADEIIAPLASNTAPSQAPGPGSTPALKDDGT